MLVWHRTQALGSGHGVANNGGLLIPCGARSLVCLFLAASTTSCVVGRTVKSVGHVLDHHHANSLLDELRLPGRELYRASLLNDCRRYTQKLQGIGCTSVVGTYFEAAGTISDLRSHLEAQIVDRGWVLSYDGPAHYPYRPMVFFRKDGVGSLVLALGREEVLRASRGLAESQEFAALLRALEVTGSTPAGVTVRFQTPSDVIKSRTCFLDDC